MFPKRFIPIFIENNELVRLGSVDDGGYVVPKQTILSSELLVSLGISDNWDFEKDFVKISKESVYAYDHSIHTNFWFSRFKKDLFKFLCLKIFKPKKLYKMFQYLDFLFFFKLNKNNKFFLKKIGNDFIQLSGEDGTALEFNLRGGRGCISVTANIAPKLCSEFQEASLAKNNDNLLARAKEINDQLMPLHKSLFIESNPSPVKYAANLLKLCSDEVRLPLVGVTSETKEKIKSAMQHANLI